jgi:prolyl oligopeptidase
MRRFASRPASGGALLRAFGGAALAALLLAGTALAGPFHYPETRKGTVVDDYFGTKVADPYRWLEDSESPEVRKWVEAENAYTRAYLDKTGDRGPIEKRLTELQNYERYGTPVERNGVLFYTYNSGLQNQSIWYVQDGLDGKPREFLDPNTLRDDGTAAVRDFSPSDDGRYVVYAVSYSGSDWEELHIREVATGKDLPGVIPNVKFTSPAWTADGKGFYYTHQPAPGTVPAGDEHYYMKVYHHDLGADPASDRLIYERPDMKEIIFDTEATDDGRWLVITASKGSADQDEVYVLPLDRPDATPTPLITGFDAAYRVIGTAGDRFLVRTNREAPRWRIVAVDPAHPEPSSWIEVVPQGADVIRSALVAGDRLVVATMHDAHSRLTLYALDGSSPHEVPLPTLGTIRMIRGRAGSNFLFFDFASFAYPSSVFRYDFEKGEAVAYRSPKVDFDASDFVVDQIWYESKDGTKVPMFLFHRKGIRLDGNNPTILYGYGGFNISETPFFSITPLFWVEQGGIFAVANLRGGGEFGEDWHHAGMLDKKQNVFDDFIAAARTLIDLGYTRTERLAIQGGSNGGLLVSAVEVQRPHLFGVVICQVPVADMLRYHRFTVARYWIPEYGSSENPKQFPFLYAYSPLQNVEPGVKYPATLITTADTDDRVHPGQVRKLAATFQADNVSDEPILLRVETRAGHGGGKPVAKRIEERADIFAFIFHEMGLPLPGAKEKKSD